MPGIPLYDPRPQIRELHQELLIAAQRVIESGTYILGPEVEAFESEMTQYLGGGYGVGTNSGTDALTIVLRALGIGDGDEVIAPTFTFFATGESIAMTGATPVLVDIEGSSFNIDPASVSERITPRTRAIVPVHLFGLAADLDGLRAVTADRDVLVIEDVAQAMGGTYKGQRLGTIGIGGAFSFFPSKNLGGFGDGGFIATRDEEIVDRCRMLRAHGAKRKYHNEELGYNSRLDAIQAAMLRVKLPLVDRWNGLRREAADRYTRAFDGIDGVVTPTSDHAIEHVFHQYTVRISDNRRDAVANALSEASIGAAIYYPRPLHLMAPLRDEVYPFPRAAAAAQEVLSLPLWPGIDADTQERVVDTILRFLR